MFGKNTDNSQNAGQAAGPPPVGAPLNPYDGGQAAQPAQDSAVPPLPPSPGTPQTPDASLKKPADTQPAGVSPDQARDDDLLNLKKDALQNLQPLMSHLDQTPEEKFKTTMMLIQATDNSALVQQAYQAANQISDEKAKAQALLDVVNEINYFTHKDENGS